MTEITIQTKGSSKHMKESQQKQKSQSKLLAQKLFCW